MSDLGNREVFSRNLKYYMKLYDKSRREVATDLNISYTTFTSWLKGTNYPRIDKIEKLANYFRINKADLIEDKYKDSSDGYYTDPEVAELAEELRTNPELKVLFSTSRNLTKEQMQEAYDYIKYLKSKETNNDD